ncbi:MAG: sugar phosphate isomerase/epimerase [Gemmatimonadetes bacterium]|nr:sugar phosphate isomerase/epimerase [Gemmatimonadota bacterium]MYA76251.1 sugar phosphate isomerase/epimerase [Gemmatimonadota bacterium]MYG16199.1 sugar phosphate isomerase/epimerase [Gemmatimonadota bacterium]MYH19488.1 sugar phosphate isomerase/epimerase [Gemmatimonadota bacterium]MYK99304.1 sugar phosphate isomerase/epimerase [Gemmatimonadota bacterium]
MFKNLNPGMIGVHASLAEALDMAAQYGFDGVDINLPDMAEVSRETSVGEVRDLFERAGRRPGNWGLPIEWHGTREKWSEELTRLHRYAALARDIGAQRTTAVVMPCSDERTFDENYAFHVERLKPVAELLGEHDCRFGLEFIGPETLRRGRKHAFVYTMDGMLALCRDLGPNVGLLLDLWHWYTSHGTWDDLARLGNGDVVNVHVNDAPAGVPVDEQIDNKRCLPGETGVLDIARFLKALDTMGYDGPVTAEPFSARVNALAPRDALRETSEAMHRAWASAGIA